MNWKDKRLAMVQGASSGIGLAWTEHLLKQGWQKVLASSRGATKSTALLRLKQHYEQQSPAAGPQRLVLLDMDLTQPATIASAAHQSEQLVSNENMQLLINASGWLHDDKHRPEKSLSELSLDALTRSFQLNSIGALLVIKHFLPRFDKTAAAAIVNLSARVGSITDNRLGGWYGYRASKAALNMLSKTLSVELRRTHPELMLLLLHPGTTDTPLSRPFQKNAPMLQSPQQAVENMMQVIAARGVEHSGQFFDYANRAIDW